MTFRRTLLCFLSPNSSSTPLTRPFMSGISRHGFIHPTLLPFPDFMLQSTDALAHEFDLAAFSHLQSFFIGSSYRLIRL